MTEDWLGLVYNYMFTEQRKGWQEYKQTGIWEPMVIIQERDNVGLDYGSSNKNNEMVRFWIYFDGKVDKIC